jgi:hypothetical protein
MDHTTHDDAAQTAPPTPPPMPEPATTDADVSLAAVTEPSPAPAAEAVPSDGDRGRDEVLSVRVREWAQRLKPVAVAAEGVTARAVNFSARGLSRLGAILDERRRRRETDRQDGSEPAAPPETHD